MNDSHTKGFSRDLPAPPERSHDNYASAIAEVYRALDEAEMVAPLEGDREWVQDVREQVRAELMEKLDNLEGGDE